MDKGWHLVDFYKLIINILSSKIWTEFINIINTKSVKSYFSINKTDCANKRGTFKA